MDHRGDDRNRAHSKPQVVAHAHHPARIRNLRNSRHAPKLAFARRMQRCKEVRRKDGGLQKTLQKQLQVTYAVRPRHLYADTLGEVRQDHKKLPDMVDRRA